MGVKSWYNGFDPRTRNQAYMWLNLGLAAGTIPTPARCSACGQGRGQIDYHAEDYSRPFGPHIHAHELCFRCHMALHGRFRQPETWRRYVEMLEAGAIYEPLWNRRELHRIWSPGWLERPIAMRTPRGELAFFRGLNLGRGDRGPDEHAAGKPARQGVLFGDGRGGRR